MRTYLFCIMLFSGMVASAYAKELTVLSPNRQIAVRVSTGREILWAVEYQGKMVLTPSPTALRLAGSRTLGVGSNLAKSRQETVNEVIQAIVPVKEKEVVNQYNEITMRPIIDWNRPIFLEALSR